VNWNYISSKQELSESFIREFKDRVDWACISSSQALSEDFIIEFQDRVKWGVIAEKQVLSDEFREKFIKKPAEEIDNEALLKTLEFLFKGFKFDSIFTVDEKGFKKMLGFFADEIRGNDAEWVLNFLSTIGFIAPYYFRIERGDIGLYLSLEDFKINDNEDDEGEEGEEDEADEIFLGMTDMFMDVPLNSGEVCNQNEDKHGIIHCGKLLEEIGIVSCGFLNDKDTIGFIETPFTRF
jgi:hypothetical protein